MQISSIAIFWDKLFKKIILCYSLVIKFQGRCHVLTPGWPRKAKFHHISYSPLLFSFCSQLSTFPHFVLNFQPFLIFPLGGRLSLIKFVKLILFSFFSLHPGDLLENYCYSDNLASLARILFAITIICTYPLECFVCREVSTSVLNYN